MMKTSPPPFLSSSFPITPKLLLLTFQLLITTPTNHAITVELPIITKGAGAATTHLVPVQLGSPLQTLYVIPDTGSKASWVYCNVNSRDHSDFFSSTTRAIFGYTDSLTLSHVRCSSPSCKESGETSRCVLAGGLCRYKHEYADGTSTNGHWVRDTVTVKTDGGYVIRVPDVMIGCSSRRLSNLADADGILGLSIMQSSLSLTLLKKMGGVFSYFISTAGDRRGIDRLIFGKTKNPLFRRQKMQHINLQPDRQDHTFFYVKIAALFIDNNKLSAIPPQVWDFNERTGAGGVVVDTGTTFMYLPETAFREVHSIYAEYMMKYESVEITDSRVCVASGDMEVAWTCLPRLGVGFEGGARLTPDDGSLFYEEHGGGVWCLGVRKGGGSVGSILGSLFQRGFFWEYDLNMQTLGFAPVDDVQLNQII